MLNKSSYLGENVPKNHSEKQTLGYIKRAPHHLIRHGVGFTISSDQYIS